jgi:prepilin peptidase CpaA
LSGGIGVAITFPFPVAVVLTATLVAAVTDVCRFKVYNWLTYPLLALGLVHGVVSGGAAGLGQSVCGLLLGVALTLPLYALGGMGAGDVKLLAGIGAWLGAPFVIALALLSSLAAGLYAVVVLLTLRKGQEAPVNFRPLRRTASSADPVEAEVQRPDRRARVIPFAAMMAVALVAILAWARFERPRAADPPPPALTESQQAPSV